jgi:prepilin-type processing-associated H-X9-DG protein
MRTFGIVPSTHHQRKLSNILYGDGHVLSRRNADQRYTVELAAGANLYDAFDLILRVLETADVSQ